MRLLALDFLVLLLVVGLVAFMQSAKSLQVASQFADSQHRFMTARAAGLCADMGPIPEVPRLPASDDPVQRLLFLQDLIPVQERIWKRNQECQEPRTVVITEDLLHFQYNRHDRFEGDWQRGLNTVVSIVDQSIRERKMIYVIGHTDKRGGDVFNYELSYRRALYIAMEIRRHLESRGLHQGTDYQLYPFGMGKSQPAERLSGEGDETWWTKCRRIELSFRGERNPGGQP